MKKMERNIAVSRKHIFELANLGVDISDASMCWVQEPNEKNFRLVVHDEYCYEMGCLNPVPAYTLQDLIVKLKGDVNCFDQGTMEDYPSVKETPWRFTISPLKNNNFTTYIVEFGATPLQAAYAAYLSVLTPEGEVPDKF